MSEGIAAMLARTENASKLYLEDFAAHTDMNCVLAEDGRFIEIQGTAEQEPFAREEMDQLLKLAVKGTTELVAAQKKALKLR